MIMASYQTLILAYGRDYKSKAEVIKAFTKGKDFVLVSTDQLCSIKATLLAQTGT